MYSIPICALSSWIFSVPKSGARFRYQLDANQRLKRLEQLGWLIEYSNYKQFDDGFKPRKIIATRVASDRASSEIRAIANNEVVVKLITKSWK